MSSDFRQSPSKPVRATSRGGTTDLVVGLINNMPVAAKRATEQQFVGLLTTASQNLNRRIGFFIIDDLAAQTDETFRILREARPDGLIVTGDEPRSSAISHEPILPALARLVDWAGDNTIASIWSCLAAHAAVFRLDGIERRRLPQKLSGLFSCAAAADHPLLAELPSQWLTPHSRHNNVDETDLLAKGYTVLSRAPRIGADSFVKQVGGSQFLMLQGHPEYAPDSLFREYRRDVRRFLAGERDTYPDMPENYFDQKTARTLEKLRDQAYQSPTARLLASVYAAFNVAPARAYPPATQLYTNWLDYLAKEKAGRDNALHWSARQQRGAA